MEVIKGSPEVPKLVSKYVCYEKYGLRVPLPEVEAGAHCKRLMAIFTGTNLHASSGKLVLFKHRSEKKCFFLLSPASNSQINDL